MTAGKESLSAKSSQLKQSTSINSCFNFVCLLLDLEPRNTVNKPSAQPPPPVAASGLKRRQEDNGANGSSKKSRTESAATQQLNAKPVGTLPSKPLTPAQAAKGKFPPLKRTERISFGARVSSPQTTNPMIGNSSAPPDSHSRATSSVKHQRPAAAHADGAGSIQTPALRSTKGPPAFAQPKKLMSRLKLTPQSSFAPSGSSATQTTTAPTQSRQAPSTAGSSKTAAAKGTSGSQRLRDDPRHLNQQRTSEAGSKQDAVRRPSNGERSLSDDDLPAPNNIQTHPRQQNPANRHTSAIPSSTGASQGRKMNAGRAKAPRPKTPIGPQGGGAAGSARKQLPGTYFLISLH